MGDERKDKLLQQYEEAALALMLEEYADAEGQRIWEEYEAACAQGEMETMPEALTAKCRQMIDRAYEKKRNRSLCKRILKAGAKVAVVAMALFGIAAATVLSVDALRVPVMNFILDRSGKFAFVNVGCSNRPLEKQYKALVKTVQANAPEDYTFVQTPVTDEAVLLISMKNSKNEKLTICIGPETNQIKIDTEDAVIEELDLQGHTAYLIIKDGPSIIWHDSKKELIISVHARSLSPDAFWKLVNALAS